MKTTYMNSSRRNLRFRFLVRLYVFAMMFMLLVGNAVAGDVSSVEIKTAEYDGQKRVLNVEAELGITGRSRADHIVTLFNHAGGELLAEESTRRSSVCRTVHGGTGT